MSRPETAPTARKLVLLTGTLFDLYCASYPPPLSALTLDIEDTVDVVRGAQQVFFWNGRHGERCSGRRSVNEFPGHVRRLINGSAANCRLPE